MRIANHFNPKVFLLKHIVWYLNNQIILVIVTLESQLDLLCLLLRFVFSLLGVEDGVWIAIDINSIDHDVSTDLVFFKVNLHVSIDAEFWNLHVQLLHEDCHNVLDSSMDDKVSVLVKWSLLEVDNDKFSTVLDHLKWDVASWSNSKR